MLSFLRLKNSIWNCPKTDIKTVLICGLIHLNQGLKTFGKTKSKRSYKMNILKEEQDAELTLDLLEAEFALQKQETKKKFV